MIYVWIQGGEPNPWLLLMVDAYRIVWTAPPSSLRDRVLPGRSTRSYQPTCKYHISYRNRSVSLL